MGFLTDWLTDWIKGLLIEGIMGNLTGLFDTVNTRVGEIAVLVQGITTSGDPIGAIWSCIGYTVLLCFTLFKTGSVAKSIFGAH